jgi:uncharacterized protein (DUF58 family)
MYYTKFKISLKIFISFILLEIYLFLLGIKTGIETFFFLFILFTVILCVNLFLLVANFLITKAIVISRKTQNQIVEGEKLSVKLSVYNPNFFPLLNLKITDSLKLTNKEIKKDFFLNWVKPKNKLYLEYSFVCEQRGYYSLGPIKIVLVDFLNLFHIEKFYNVIKNVYVYPKIFNIKNMIPLVRGNFPWFGLETTSVSGDEHEFFGVREYKQGDPIKRIHWLSTAKKNQLIVKEFQRRSFYRVTIIFVLNKNENLGVGKKSVAEYIIKIVASLAKYFIERNITIEILSHAGKVYYFPPNKGKGYLEEIFKFCSIINAESKITISEFFLEHSKFIYPNSTLFVLLTENNLDSLVEIIQFKKYNVNIIPLIIISSTFLFPFPSKEEINALKSKILTKLSNAKLTSLFFCKEDNLEEIFLKITEYK